MIHPCRPSSTALLTAHDIAVAIGEPLHRVQYVLRTRRDDLPPALIASQTRLFPPSAIAIVRAAIKGIDARRHARSEPANHGDRS